MLIIKNLFAHCIAEEKRNLADLIDENLSSKIILIGPEGDFTIDEIELAVQHQLQKAIVDSGFRKIYKSADTENEAAINERRTKVNLLLPGCTCNT